jgi:adenine/guanine/hypoxanthine permease
VLTYFGFMHGPAVGTGGGLGVTPAVALAYAVMALFLLGCDRFKVAEPVGRARAVPAE